MKTKSINELIREFLLGIVPDPEVPEIGKHAAICFVAGVTEVLIEISEAMKAGASTADITDLVNMWMKQCDALVNGADADTAGTRSLKDQ